MDTPSPCPRHLLVHSPLGVAHRSGKGLKDKLMRLGEEYRLNSEDVKIVVLYRRDGIVNCNVTQGIIQTSYFKDYARLL